MSLVCAAIICQKQKKTPAVVASFLYSLASAVWLRLKYVLCYTFHSASSILVMGVVLEAQGSNSFSGLRQFTM
jgi:hypothetical protein